MLLPIFGNDGNLKMMVAKRECVAQLLDRTRVFDWILSARSRMRAPVLSVLCYHSVGVPGSDYLFDADIIDVTPARFREQLAIVERHFTVIGVDELCAGMGSGKWPANPLLITFDDGYRSCVDVALPILREFGFPATFFIATTYINERRLYWWDRINYLIKRSPRARIRLEYPRVLELELDDRARAVRRLLRVVKDEYKLELEAFLQELAGASAVTWSRELETRLASELVMTWDDVRKLRDLGMDIESHTRSHRVLQTMDVIQLTDELAGSRADIEREVGAPARTIAYPVGYSIRHIPMIKQAVERAGYKVGFTSGTGVNYLRRDMDPMDIRRVAMARELSLSMFRGFLAVPPLAYSRAYP